MAADEEPIVRYEIARHPIWPGAVIQPRTSVLHQLRRCRLDDLAVDQRSLLHLAPPRAECVMTLRFFSFAATGIQAITASTRFHGTVVGMRVYR